MLVRIKTESEFIKSHGKGWRDTVHGWRAHDMDYLLGKYVDVPDNFSRSVMCLVDFWGISYDMISLCRAEKIEKVMSIHAEITDDEQEKKNTIKMEI